MRVNALSGLYLISTLMTMQMIQMAGICVSMPSRAYTSFLHEPMPIGPSLRS